MANTPLTMQIPLKGTLYLRLDGQEQVIELGKVTYHADVNVQLQPSTISPTTFEFKKN
jgi:hypothetical protein